MRLVSVSLLYQVAKPVSLVGWPCKSSSSDDPDTSLIISDVNAAILSCWLKKLEYITIDIRDKSVGIL